MEQFSLNNYVSEVGVITADPERRKKVRREFQKIHTKALEFPGVYVTPEETKNASKCRFVCPSANVVGVYMAHRQIWEYMLHKGLPNIAIFEDDVKFKDDIFTVLPKAFHELPPDWDIVYLGCLSCHRRSWLDTTLCPRPPTPFSPHLNRPACLMGTEAYIVSRKGAQKLLEHLETPITHLDLQIMLHKNTLDIYVMTPTVAFQDPEGFVYSSNRIHYPWLLSYVANNVPFYPIDKHDGRTLNWMLSHNTLEIPHQGILINGWWIMFLVLSMVSTTIGWVLLVYIGFEFSYLWMRNRLSIDSSSSQTPPVRLYVSYGVAILLGISIRRLVFRKKAS